MFIAGCSNAGGDAGASAGSSGGLTEGTGSGSTGSATGDGTTSGDATTLPTSDGPTGDPTGSPTGDPTSSPTGDPTGEPTTGELTTGDPSAGTSTGETGDGTTGAPSDGCGQDPGFRGDMAQTMMVDGTEREYILVVPEGYDPAKAYPLVFAWHGRGSNGAQARLYFKVEEASQGQAIFVYPDGLPLAEMMDQTGWDLDPNNEDFAFFDALVADIEGRLCVDSDRIFSTGHSFGGYMSIQLACYRADVLRGIGEVAGGGPFGTCSGQVAAWLAHGTLDAIVPYSEGENARDFMTGNNNCDAQADAVDPAPCTAFAGCDAGMPVHWCSHDIAEFSGHTWPGWAGAGIWNFFASL